MPSMCRASGVSIRWLMDFLVACCDAVPEPLPGHLPGHPGDDLRRCVEAEADEMGSIVKKRANKPWRWLAIDRTTRQRMAFDVGDRRRDRARQLWVHLPAGYREPATCYTYPYEVYTGVRPAARHQASTKKAQKTHPIERCNNTRRQRVSRVVREPLACSKKLANHSGARR